LNARRGMADDRDRIQKGDRSDDPSGRARFDGAI
jgi:hypothetical protein